MARAALAVFGDKQLDAAFRRLERVDQRKGLKKAAREAFRPVLAAARAGAPLGPTRKLRKYIRLRALKSRRGFIGVVVRTGTRKEMGISEDAKGYYPAHVELGTSRMQAKPFLRPAFDSKKTRVERVFNVKLWRFIREEWGR